VSDSSPLSDPEVKNVWSVAPPLIRLYDMVFKHGKNFTFS
jgi:hypothetical protein